MAIQTDVEETTLPGQVLHIGVAQRYSFLVTARNDTSSNWGIHLNLDTSAYGSTLPAGLKPSTIFHAWLICIILGAHIFLLQISLPRFPTTLLRLALTY